MKKLLAILGAFGLTATGATTVVACNKGNKQGENLGGLKASDFAKALFGSTSKEDLNTKVVTIISGKVTDAGKNKEINDNLVLFGMTFVVAYKTEATFPLAKGAKITLTITKSTDAQIKSFYKEKNTKDISDNDLALAKKMQGYVSGTEFSSEITIEDATPPTAPVNISKATIKTGAITDPFEIQVGTITEVTGEELSALNTNATITDAVLKAIQAVDKAPQEVTLGTDYEIANNGQPGDYTTKKAVVFTVTAKGEKITGTFNFTVEVKGKAAAGE
ncbi:spiralin lipoprotein [Spiroplasma endosymbiont of Stenodema calcarata]|uniref:spiralin lipoprotein n=1 Tax=Spiroplasma endosymbiont of Stenodema calcarata TaxID=3139328 RepID=UPI003CCA87ED